MLLRLPLEFCNTYTYKNTFRIGQKENFLGRVPKVGYYHLRKKKKKHRSHRVYNILLNSIYSRIILKLILN